MDQYTNTVYSGITEVSGFIQLYTVMHIGKQIIQYKNCSIIFVH